MNRQILSLTLAATLAAPLTARAEASGAVAGTVDARPAKYLKDTIVFIKHVSGVDAAPRTLEIDQRRMEFVPHVAILAKGDRVVFENHDHVDHDVSSPEGGYDLGTFGFGQSRTRTFDRAGVYEQICKVHPEMLAYVFVGQNRFAAPVDADGRFTIAGVPPGTYQLDVWNPKLKAAPQTVTVDAKAAASIHFSLAR